MLLKLQIISSKTGFTDRIITPNQLFVILHATKTPHTQSRRRRIQHKSSLHRRYDK